MLDKCHHLAWPRVTLGLATSGITMVELMDQSEEDTWKVKNILESGERIFCYGKVASCMRGEWRLAAAGRWSWARPLEIF